MVFNAWAVLLIGSLGGWVQPDAREGPFLEEKAALRAGEGAFLVDRQPAALQRLACRGAPVHVVTAVFPHTHAVHVATQPTGRGRGPCPIVSP